MELGILSWGIKSWTKPFLTETFLMSVWIYCYAENSCRVKQNESKQEDSGQMFLHSLVTVFCGFNAGRTCRQ